MFSFSIAEAVSRSRRQSDAGSYPDTVRKHWAVTGELSRPQLRQIPSFPIAHATSMSSRAVEHRFQRETRVNSSLSSRSDD